MRPLAIAAVTYCAMSLLAVAVWAVVAPRLLRDEDAPLCPSTHWDDETCPGCDPGPDDLPFNVIDLADLHELPIEDAAHIAAFRAELASIDAHVDAWGDA